VFSISGLVIFNLFNIILVQCKLERFQFGAGIVLQIAFWYTFLLTHLVTEILTDEQLREGTRQLSRHKRTMVVILLFTTSGNLYFLQERAYQRKALRAHIDGSKAASDSTVSKMFSKLGLAGNGVYWYFWIFNVSFYIEDAAPVNSGGREHSQSGDVDEELGRPTVATDPPGLHFTVQ
jgi:hypothetical protein